MQQRRGSSSKRSSMKTSKRKAVEHKEADEGPSSGTEQPVSQSPKTVKKPRIASPDDNVNNDSDNTSTKLQVNSEGDKYVDLGNKRRITVRSFKGKTLVDIREYYGAEGDEKPGKKGISLTAEQWKSVVQASTAIDSLL